MRARGRYLNEGSKTAKLFDVRFDHTTKEIYLKIYIFHTESFVRSFEDDDDDDVIFSCRFIRIVSVGEFCTFTNSVEEEKKRKETPKRKKKHFFY